MKFYKLMGVMLMAASLVFSLPVFAQMHTGNMGAGMNSGQMGEMSESQMMDNYGNGRHINPDSLTEITVTGTVIIDSSNRNAMYLR